MNWVVTWLLVALVVWMLLAAATRPGKIYEFPFLAGTMTFSFILPQLPGLASDPFLPPESYQHAIIFTIMCIAMCRIGWMPNRPVMRAFQWRFDEKRLLIVAALLSAIGAYFYHKLAEIPIDEAVYTMFTGTNVVFFFFSKLLRYGLCIALLCFFLRPSWPALVIALIDTALYLDRIVMTGKRSETTQLVLMFAMAVWFLRRRSIPHILFLSWIVVGTVLASATHDYREMSRRTNDNPTLSSLSEISPIEKFEQMLSKGGPEMRNAILRINAMERNMAFDFGSIHWDTLVWNFVPQQLVGPELKESLYVGMEEEQIDRSYDRPTGTSETGMTDAFASFWWFGSIKFFLLAYFMSRLYGAAMAGHAAPQMFYMLLAVPAMNSISHYTQWVVSEWVHVAAFLIPCLLYARIRAPAGQPAVAAAIVRAS
ncbi:hypothetical protein AB4Z01_19405 [Inquilinus sp. YAF38]|uniref:hypothetical protein n=1 Tax=Inquilinus sp. YAF38 TaxID=3233084 RepID=UPI003F8E8A97